MEGTKNNPEPAIVSCKNEEGKDTFSLTDSAKQNLMSNINMDTPIVVASVAGVYRTGKSYLMSRLTGSDGTFFPLGATVQSKTKGIWIWVGKHPRDSNINLVLLDTEGLEDIEKSDERHDNIIFALAVILSDVFVFNSVRAVDDKALTKLHFILELAEHLRKKTEGANTESADDTDDKSPNFVWAVRDFTLKCEVNGNQVSDDEYLEWNLEEKTEMGASNEEDFITANRVRAGLKEYFPKRKLFLFPYPTLDADKLNSLEKVLQDQLDPNFVEKSESFCDHVWSLTDSRLVGGKKMTGSMLVSLIESVIGAVNNGANVPSVTDAFAHIANRENDRALKMALEAYDGMWKKYMSSFPLLPDYLDMEGKKVAKDAFKHIVIGRDSELNTQLDNELSERYTYWMEEIRLKSVRATEEALEKLYKFVEGKMGDGEYAKPGGFQDYNSDMAKIAEEIRNDNTLGSERTTVLEQFLKEKEAEKQQIMQLDQKYSEAVLSAEIERTKKEEAIEREAAAREAQKLAVIERKDLRKKLEEKMATLTLDLQESSVQEVQACREMSEAAAAIHTAEVTKEAQDAVQVLKDQVDSMNQAIIDKEKNMQEEMARKRKELDDKLKEEQARQQRELASVQPPRVICGPRGIRVFGKRIRF